MSNKKIIDYYVVEGTNKAILNKNVTEMIQKGFQPFKSLVVVPGSFTWNFYQSMVKYED